MEYSKHDIIKSNQFSFMNNPLSIDKNAFSKKVVNLNQKLNDTMMENTKKQESISDYSSGSNKM